MSKCDLSEATVADNSTLERRTVWPSIWQYKANWPFTSTRLGRRDTLGSKVSAFRMLLNPVQARLILDYRGEMWYTVVS
jgi:hypothetical protein